MATKPKSADQKTLDLIAEIKRRKAEISKSERPNYRTNCTFGYEEKSSNTINLQTLTDVKTLIQIASFLQDREESYKKTVALLEVEAAPDFTWSGFMVKEWLEDIKARINKVQIGTKKKQLEALEARAKLIISPELQREMELEAIANELK